MVTQKTKRLNHATLCLIVKISNVTIVNITIIYFRVDESMRAVTFGHDPPFELLLVSGVFGPLVVYLLVRNSYFLTDVFVEDEQSNENMELEIIEKDEV